MRLGLVCDPVGEHPEALAKEAALAERLGFDLLLIDGPSEEVPSAPMLAAALASATSVIRVAVGVALGSTHPLYTAEECAVADQALAGRLVVCARAAEVAEGAPAQGHADSPAQGLAGAAAQGAAEGVADAAAQGPGGAGERFGEAVDVLLAAWAARPFQHAGPTWRVPARLPGNAFAEDEAVRVTPPPHQLELPLWLSGPGAEEAATARGISLLGGAEDGREALAAAWARTDAALGRATLRLRRPAVRAVPAQPAGGEIDAGATVAMLRAERQAWGMDVALLALPPGLAHDTRAHALRRLAREVRPRVQLDRLPDGLEQEWDRREGR